MVKPITAVAPDGGDVSARQTFGSTPTTCTTNLCNYEEKDRGESIRYHFAKEEEYYGWRDQV